MTPRNRVRRRFTGGVVGVAAAMALVIALAWGAVRPFAGHRPANDARPAASLADWSPIGSSGSSVSGSLPGGTASPDASSSWQ